MTFPPPVCIHGKEPEICQLCKPKQSNPTQQIQQLVFPRPITWDAIGMFMNGESTFTAGVWRGRFKAGVTIPQSNHETSGYQLLVNIRNFIEKELNLKGKIHLLRPPNQYALEYWRLLDSYKLTAHVLPYLRHPKKSKTPYTY